MNGRDLTKRFRAARPFEHLVLDDFLEPALAAALVGELPKPAAMSLSKAYGGAKRLFTRDIARLGPAFRALDRRLRGRAFLARLAAIAGEPLVRNPAGSCGGLFLDSRGMELDPHLDVNATVPGRRRRLTLLLYLNPVWRASWGGALELFRDPARPPAKTILPVFNRCVLMASHERSWHAYSRIAIPPRLDGRRVLIVNFYGAKGVARAAPPHYNTWMPRRLPTSAAAGRPLAPRDLAEIRRRLRRRDDLIAELRAVEAAAGVTRPFSPGTIPALRAGRAPGAAALRDLKAAFSSRDAELERLYAAEWGYRRLAS